MLYKLAGLLMAVSFVAAGTFEHASGATSTVSPSIPAGMQAGDVMVLFFFLAADNTVNVPSGWTAVNNEQWDTGWGGNNQACRVLVAYRAWQSGDSAPTCSIPDDAEDQNRFAQIAGFRGVDTADPMPDAGSTSSGSGTSLGPISGFTPTNAGADGAVLVLGCMGNDWTGADVLTGDSLTWVEIGENSTTAKNDAACVWDYALYSGSAPTITDKSFTVSDIDDDWAGKMFSLKAAGGAVTGTGALAAGASAASGAGVSSSTGTGALQAGPSTIAGSDSGDVTGTGALAAGAASISGSGVSSSTGTGALASGASSISGTDSADFIRLKIEYEASGQGNGWTDLSLDVHKPSGVDGSRGNHGQSPRDLVAPTGVMTLALMNHAGNSGGLQGYYTPGHTNQRSGFKVGAGIRASVLIGSNTKPIWTGTIGKIEPSPGRFQEQLTHVTAYDYMDKLARLTLSDLETQENIKEEAVFQAIVDAMPIQPRAVEKQTGFDTFPYAFDITRDERDAPLTEMQRLAQSALSRVHPKGDGTLVYEIRSTRATPSDPILSITEDDLLIVQRPTVEDNEADRVNRVQCVIAPRVPSGSVGSEVVLARLNTAQSFEPGGPFSVRLLFTDPAQRAIRAGGIDMLSAVENTDYEFNTAQDGSGSDVSASVVVNTSFTSNAVIFSITNNAGVKVWAVNSSGTPLLQARGVGVLAQEPLSLEDSDAALITEFGENAFTLEMPYQADIPTTKEVSQYLLHVLKQDRKIIRQIPILLNGSDPDRALLFANREISDRIAITETMTALSGYEFFINAIDFRLDPNGAVWLYWTPAQADTTAFWFLEVVGNSELGQTTRLGFGYVVGHTDVAHGDFHGDVSHDDTAHADSHTDDSHGDAGHGDAGHGDSHSDVSHTDSHSDQSHQDSAHADTSHADSHSDVSHSDVAHVDSAHTDSHSDQSHEDNYHLDHADEPHGDHDDTHADGEGEFDHDDVAHGDSHSDVSHGDSHADVSHGDSHSDQSHSDSPHSDTAHADSHSDVSHGDSHADASHTDSGHVDSAHGDSHTDDSHVDEAHGDEHSDSSHGDQNLIPLLFLLGLTMRALGLL